MKCEKKELAELGPCIVLTKKMEEADLGPIPLFSSSGRVLELQINTVGRPKMAQ